MAGILRVLLDCTSAAKPSRGGVQNYTRGLVLALRRHVPDIEPVVAIRASHRANRTLLDDLADGPVRILLPFGRAGADVLHATGVKLPLFPRVPAMVTVHDLGVFDAPELYRPAWAARRRRRIAGAVARADAVLVYTEHTRERLRHRFPALRASIAVTPLGVDHDEFQPAADDGDARVLAPLGVHEPYVLTAGLLSTRKDPLTALRGFARTDARRGVTLVMAGKAEATARAELEAEAARLGIAAQVMFTGYVPDGAMPALYRRARVFLFSSRYEGFGLPLLEAMACGTPVIAARNGCCEDVAGAAARFFEPGDVQELASHLQAVLSDAAQAQRLRDLGLARSALYTWRRTAELTAEAYRALAAARARR